MRRTVIPELLDSDAGTPAEVQASLADLRRINRWFGGSRTMCRLITAVADTTGQRAFSLLDVAGASGDIPHYCQAKFSRAGVRLDVTLLDRATTHISPLFPAVAGDVLAMPFAEASFDLVTCSLFLHHLEPDQIAVFLREALRVARVAVLLNDLRRHPLHLALVYAGMPLYRSRLTRHDGPVSIRRSYTSDELKTFISQSPAAALEAGHYYLFRTGVIAWKTAPGTMRGR